MLHNLSFSIPLSLVQKFTIFRFHSVAVSRGVQCITSYSDSATCLKLRWVADFLLCFITHPLMCLLLLNLFVLVAVITFNAQRSDQGFKPLRNAKTHCKIKLREHRLVTQSEFIGNIDHFRRCFSKEKNSRQSVRCKVNMRYNKRQTKNVNIYIVICVSKHQIFV